MQKRLLPLPVSKSQLSKLMIPGATAKSAARKRCRNLFQVDLAQKLLEFDEWAGQSTDQFHPLLQEIQDAPDDVLPISEASTIDPESTTDPEAVDMDEVQEPRPKRLLPSPVSQSQLLKLVHGATAKSAARRRCRNLFQVDLSQKLPELAEWAGQNIDQCHPLLQEIQDASDDVLPIYDLTDRAGHDTDQFDLLPSEIQDASDAISSISKPSATDMEAADMDEALEPQDENEEAVWSWLKGLDGRGSMLKYFKKIRDEFQCDFSQIAAVF